jgi:hypothetical protein
VTITLIVVDVTVPLGGFLFEYFMWTASGYAMFRLFQTTVANIGNDEAIPDLQQQEFMQAAGSRFAGWLLWHVGNIGSNGRDQLFYLTLVANYHGLSRNGIDLLSRFGYVTNLKRFDDRRKMRLLQSRTSTRSVIIPFQRVLMLFHLTTCHYSKSRHHLLSFFSVKKKKLFKIVCV